MIEQAEIHWHLNDSCNYKCFYCLSKYSAGKNKKTIDQYLNIIEKLQSSKYKFARTIKWKLGGGEPLHFTGLNILLKKIKSKPSYVRLDTSGGETWFEMLEIKNLIDHVLLTHHYWQNISVLNYIIDFALENNKKLNIIIPLQPRKILECRELIEKLKTGGIEVHEQILYDEEGKMISEYNNYDLYLITGKSDSDNKPAPYVDLSIPPKDDTPSYTGLPCYAGMDYMFISAKGYISGSVCGGRNLGNIFDQEWSPVNEPFACVMNFCRSAADRKKIRINQ